MIKRQDVLLYARDIDEIFCKLLFCQRKGHWVSFIIPLAQIFTWTLTILQKRWGGKVGGNSSMINAHQFLEHQENHSRICLFNLYSDLKDES